VLGFGGSGLVQLADLTAAVPTYAQPTTISREKVMDLLETEGFVFDIDAGWEVNAPDGAICRWCYIYHLMLDDEGETICDENGWRIVGVAAGYSGGGSFEVERFYLVGMTPDDISKLYIEGQGEVIGGTQFETNWWVDMDPKIVAIAEASYHTFFKWHALEDWEGADRLSFNWKLRSDSYVVKKSSKKAGTMYYALTDDDNPWTQTLRERLGLTAGRVFE
jgi:hypothetical protein